MIDLGNSGYCLPQLTGKDYTRLTVHGLHSLYNYRIITTDTPFAYSTERARLEFGTFWIAFGGIPKRLFEDGSKV